MGLGRMGLTQQFFADGPQEKQKFRIFFAELGFQFLAQLFCQGRAFAGSGNGNDQISSAKLWMAG